MSTAAAAPRVVDADWSLGVSASSSELQAIGSTFVVLRLHTERTDGSAQYVHLGKKRRAPFLFSMARSPQACASDAPRRTAFGRAHAAALLRAAPSARGGEGATGALIASGLSLGRLSLRGIFGIATRHLYAARFEGGIHRPRA